MAGKTGEKIAVPGFVCGGAGFASKQIRYVLNGTPAASKGMQVGDTVLSINDKQDWTYGDIVKNGNQVLDIKVQRGERLLTFAFKPVHSELYPAYVNAMERSLKYIKKGWQNSRLYPCLCWRSALSRCPGRACPWAND
jgi:hypothetical protein